VAVLYALLVGSAALTFWGWQPEITPWLFLTFLVFFAFYRLGLVRAGKYRAFKAFFQIGLGFLVWLLLMPAFRRPPSLAQRPHASAIVEELSDPDPRIRALAAEVAGYRPEGHDYAAQLVQRLQDPDPKVREVAHRSLVQLTGADLGPADDPGAQAAWRSRYP
jgi:hypothetical protein